MNRVLEAIAKREARFAAKDKAAIDKAEEATDKMTVMELARCQDIKSQGQAAGIITEEEAMSAYVILGRENPTVEKWRSRTLAEKMTVLELMWELTRHMRLGVDESGGQPRTRGTTTRKQAHRRKRQ